ncbi:MAG: PilZ domain-containing protein [Byssovorax sp.]
MAARDHFRAHARRRVELGAVLRSPGGLTRQDVRIRDLGLGGVCIELPEVDAAPRDLGRAAARPGPVALEREASVTLEVLAPSLWDPLVLAGKIAWIRRSGPGRATRAGVRFEHREPSALYALFQLLGAHAYDA